MKRLKTFEHYEAYEETQNIQEELDKALSFG